MFYVEIESTYMYVQVSNCKCLDKMDAALKCILLTTTTLLPRLMHFRPIDWRPVKTEGDRWTLMCAPLFAIHFRSALLFLLSTLCYRLAEKIEPIEPIHSLHSFTVSLTFHIFSPPLPFPYFLFFVQIPVKGGGEGKNSCKFNQIS